MKDRIREIRKDAGLNQTEFGGRIGVAQTTIAGYENGSREVPNVVVTAICDKFGIREEWLRDGIEPMYAPTGREEEMARLVKRLMADKPDSFQSALVTTLLRFDPDGPEWDILERIYNSIAAEKGNGENA